MIDKVKGFDIESRKEFLKDVAADETTSAGLSKDIHLINVNV